jgi:hypothetical protein
VFRHTALGFLEEEQRKGVRTGWDQMMERVKKAAEAQQ